MDNVESFEKRLQTLADESSFTLADWQAAVRVMRTWLKENHLTLSDPSLLQYIDCCAEGQNVSAAFASLEETTRDYLNAYGCASAEAEDLDLP